MRLIYTISDVSKGHKLSTFLTEKGIENQLETSVDTDWGSHTYGSATGKIWVYDEDRFEEAMQWVDAFEKNPDDPQFSLGTVKPLRHLRVPDSQEDEVLKKKRSGFESFSRAKSTLRNATLRPEPMDKITSVFLALCCFIFIVCGLTEPSYTKLPHDLPAVPLTAAPLEKALLYDYPHAFELLDKVVKLYGIDTLQSPQDLPAGGQYLLAEFYKTPHWEGGYDFLVRKLQGKDISHPLPPLFEKIQQGEVWRLFSSCLLHGDILHLVFNMLWLVVLGKQMGQRVRAGKYIFFVLLVGIISNTCQYLVSGPNFLGFSGVLCGMLAFIWVRQKMAPWEGYPLPRSTILFMLYFILTMLGIQLVSFYMEIEYQTSLTPMIANTAHFAGAIVGALLGCFSFFSWNTANSQKGIS